MSTPKLHRNTGLDIVRATEAAAMSAARWMGLGQRDEPNRSATVVMAEALNSLEINGWIVIGEEGRPGAAVGLTSGQRVGQGTGVPMDVVVDPVDGRRLLAQGRSGAIAVAAVAVRDALWSPAPAVYLEKLVVNRAAAAALVPECLDAPAAWTLALVARAKGKPVRDLVVFVLERPRHADLISEIRAAGARVMLADDGDISGAILAALPDGAVDLMLGVGGAAEGVIAACGVKALGGGMLARMAPQSAAEREAIRASGRDLSQILTLDDLVAGEQIFFVATGITDSSLLDGVYFYGDRARTNSLILRGETRTRRTIVAEHLIDDAEHPLTPELPTRL
jgi:fructose-1,6-bisphosphatase II